LIGTCFEENCIFIKKGGDFSTFKKAFPEIPPGLPFKSEESYGAIRDGKKGGDPTLQCSFSLAGFPYSIQAPLDRRLIET
jgi:hypothetical protein